MAGGARADSSILRSFSLPVRRKCVSDTRLASGGRCGDGEHRPEIHDLGESPENCTKCNIPHPAIRTHVAGIRVWRRALTQRSDTGPHYRGAPAVTDAISHR